MIITNVPGGVSLDATTAVSSDILLGQTAYNGNKEKLTGTMTNRGAWTGSTSGSGNIAIPAGYHNGSGYVSGADSYSAGRSSAMVGTATADKVISGYTFTNSSGVGITGTYTPLSATIEVSTRSGSTVTCVQGASSLTPTISGTVYRFYPQQLGTWTVTVTVDSMSVSQNVVVSGVELYSVNGIYYTITCSGGSTTTEKLYYGSYLQYNGTTYTSGSFLVKSEDTVNVYGKTGRTDSGPEGATNIQCIAYNGSSTSGNFATTYTLLGTSTITKSQSCTLYNGSAGGYPTGWRDNLTIATLS